MIDERDSSDVLNALITTCEARSQLTAGVGRVVLMQHSMPIKCIHCQDMPLRQSLQLTVSKWSTNAAPHHHMPWCTMARIDKIR